MVTQEQREKAVQRTQEKAARDAERFAQAFGHGKGGRGKKQASQAALSAKGAAAAKLVKKSTFAKQSQLSQLQKQRLEAIGDFLRASKANDKIAKQRASLRIQRIRRQEFSIAKTLPRTVAQVQAQQQQKVEKISKTAQAGFLEESQAQVIIGKLIKTRQSQLLAGEKKKQKLETTIFELEKKKAAEDITRLNRAISEAKKNPPWVSSKTKSSSSQKQKRALAKSKSEAFQKSKIAQQKGITDMIARRNTLAKKFNLSINTKVSLSKAETTPITTANQLREAKNKLNATIKSNNVISGQLVQLRRQKFTPGQERPLQKPELRRETLSGPDSQVFTPQTKPDSFIGPQQPELVVSDTGFQVGRNIDISRLTDVRDQPTPRTSENILRDFQSALAKPADAGLFGKQKTRQSEEPTKLFGPRQPDLEKTIQDIQASGPLGPLGASLSEFGKGFQKEIKNVGVDVAAVPIGFGTLGYEFIRTGDFEGSVQAGTREATKFAAPLREETFVSSLFTGKPFRGSAEEAAGSLAVPISAIAGLIPGGKGKVAKVPKFKSTKVPLGKGPAPRLRVVETVARTDLTSPFGPAIPSSEKILAPVTLGRVEAGLGRGPLKIYLRPSPKIGKRVTVGTTEAFKGSTKGIEPESVEFASKQIALGRGTGKIVFSDQAKIASKATKWGVSEKDAQKILSKQTERDLTKQPKTSKSKSGQETVLEQPKTRPVAEEFIPQARPVPPKSKPPIPPRPPAPEAGLLAGGIGLISITTPQPIESPKLIPSVKLDKGTGFVFEPIGKTTPKQTPRQTPDEIIVPRQDSRPRQTPRQEETPKLIVPTQPRIPVEPFQPINRRPPQRPPGTGRLIRGRAGLLFGDGGAASRFGGQFLNVGFELFPINVETPFAAAPRVGGRRRTLKGIERLDQQLKFESKRISELEAGGLLEGFITPKPTGKRVKSKGIIDDLFGF